MKEATKDNLTTPDVLLVSYKDVCKMLSVSTNHFFGLRETGRFPVRPIRLGRSVRYNRHQVEDWIASGCSQGWRAR